MIVKQVRGDIFHAPQQHIAFAVNTQGYNDAGFAGQISSTIWPELADTGGNTLGEVLTLQKDGRYYHALVCHSLDRESWAMAPQVVTQCLNRIDMSSDEKIAVVLMGSGPVGRMMGADVNAILEGIERSEKNVVVYTR